MIARVLVVCTFCWSLTWRASRSDEHFFSWSTVWSVKQGYQGCQVLSRA